MVVIRILVGKKSHLQYTGPFHRTFLIFLQGLNQFLVLCPDSNVKYIRCRRDYKYRYGLTSDEPQSSLYRNQFAVRRLHIAPGRFFRQYDSFCRTAENKE